MQNSLQTLTIYQAGNSAAVTIPRRYLEELGLVVGQSVVMEKIPETEALLITPTRKNVVKTGVTTEFRKWLANFLDEDAAILKGLADR
ncbi:MAG: hypothetical protein AAB838_03880 [Patescibacteria group bacterium]